MKTFPESQYVNYYVKGNLIDYFELTYSTATDAVSLEDLIGDIIWYHTILKGRGIIHYVVLKKDIENITSINLKGKTIVVPEGYYLMSDLPFSNGCIVQKEFVDPMDFGATGNGNTDDSEAIALAIECANGMMLQKEKIKINEEYDEKIISKRNNISIQFPSGKTFLISRSFEINFGVSIDFGGSMLLVKNDNIVEYEDRTGFPTHISTSDVGVDPIGYIQYDGVYYIFLVNTRLNESGNRVWKEEYPEQNCNYFRNLKFKVTNPLLNLGLLRSMLVR